MSTNLERGVVVAGLYRLDSPLGEGGFGTVWRATEVATGRPVALKALKGRIDKISYTRFEREAEALERIDHPNCVRLEAFGFSDEIGAAYLVTEFLDGQTLDDWARPGHSVEVIINVAAQLASALNAAHCSSIVHRDLKPANVMIVEGDAGPLVKVLDFGIARMMGIEGSDITKTGEIIGTVGYMSPEQLRGKRDIGPPTDLYCLGVLLFELLEGRRLFTGDTALETAMKHLTDESPRLTRAVPAPIATLVDRLLRKEPEERPGALETMRILGASSARMVEIVEVRPERSSLPWVMLGAIVVAVGCFLLFRTSETPRARRPLPPELLASRPEPTSTSKAESPPVVQNSGSRSAGCGVEQTAGHHSSFLVDVHRLSIPTYLPRGYDGHHAHPVVLLIPERRSSPEEIMADAHLTDFADTHGVVLAALRTPKSGEDGNWKDQWTVSQLESEWEKFLTLSEQICVDHDRVFLFGRGGGARGVEGLMCTHAVAGGITFSRRIGVREMVCKPDRPVPRLGLSPVDSRNDPVEGGIVAGCRTPKYAITPLEDQEAETRRQNHCDGERRILERYGESVCYTWGCAVPTVLCRLEGGRGWPNSDEVIDGGKCDAPPAKFPLGDVIWRFMESVSEAPRE